MNVNITGLCFGYLCFVCTCFSKERQLLQCQDFNQKNFTSYDVIRVVPLYAVGTILQAGKNAGPFDGWADILV